MRMSRLGRPSTLVGCLLVGSLVFLGGCSQPQAPKDPNIPPPMASPVPPAAMGTAPQAMPTGGPTPDGGPVSGGVR